MLDMDFDNYGFTGEYVYGDDAYISDEHMDERWKRIKNYIFEYMKKGDISEK